MKGSEMKLRECPLCGGKDGNLSMCHQFTACWIICNVCGLNGPAADTEKDAAASWNHRVLPPEVKALVEKTKALVVDMCPHYPKGCLRCDVADVGCCDIGPTLAAVEALYE